MFIGIIAGIGVLALLVAIVFRQRVLAVRIEDGAASAEEVSRLKEISDAIAEGAMAFLGREYRVMAIFMLLFAVLIWFTVDHGMYTALSFLIGSATSVVSGYIGMKIATKGNVRTASAARLSITKAFRVAFESGAVMGFGLTGLAVLGLLLVYLGIDVLMPLSDSITREIQMEILSGFGLGGSSVALFGRVGGGIYTKAADVGADLVGKVEAGIPEDDPRNPAVIADNVGDNVGDIAGMGADLFGSVAESTCAALVIGAAAYAATPETSQNLGILLFPMMVNAVGIVASLISLFFVNVKHEDKVEGALKSALIISTVLMLAALWPVTQWAFGSESFMIGTISVNAVGVFTALAAGLIAGLLIGLITEFYTSHAYKPVREVADASKTGAATNIIYGLALGYNSAVLPMLLIAASVVVGYVAAGMYGIALTAIGMLGTIAVGLTIDAYGPTSDNAGGIAEMAEMGKDIRKRTDALDAAGNTTAAIGKGFAIGSAALTSLALTGAFLTRAQGVLATQGKTLDLSITDPNVLAGLLVGGALPFAFSAMTMKSVGKAAFDMIEEVRRQFRTIPGLMEGKARAEYAKCVDISTKASIREMIAPGLLVILTPLIIGFLFGPQMLAGVLIGALVVGVMLAVSMANSGGAWDNAKKYIETGVHGGKGSDTHKAAVVGDTVGDPFKDTSGPSLNILIKLMAIISLVFAGTFATVGGILLR
ncbi:MAG: V-type H(+)-translocating pyrophosphatase [Chlorobi bacterium]|nr:MAG: V-type H(+)-translocating pyrophosphatase [Bacteroidota bacterium]KXK34241.1 MAG: inorganic pyrophosphatase [Chlorobi bacterium OLB6]MBE2266278.1 V-type H(+)-translocating pyrophosphatase [Flavobacteriales bacterium]MBL1161042.1 V-type H(+)-translocating pyrophosphatase [Chlorobiota bacterium]MBW7854547.1 V-type H(+)-translocating pyrophosphatase [Candidatus Kapabacteria bacterium]MCC6330340.1 V-type H(+)-translocating pyrophosphatase [Ignavibacteria bacterium]